MNYQHKNLANGRWFEFSFYEQMANIGAEIGRAIKWKNKGNVAYSRLAFERGLELLSLTIDDLKNRGPKLKELCRLYEVLVDYFRGKNEYASTDENLEKYFMFFNYMARVKNIWIIYQN